MHKVYLLTGSNIGNALQNLQRANDFIENQIGKIEAKSLVYKTEPWGNKEQEIFLNQLIVVHTDFSAQQVLKSILAIETEMGRNRLIKWEPRIIDIDILFFDDTIIDETDLKIPHPFIHERRFALIPLNEISPNFLHPVYNKTISELLQTCTDTGIVERLI